jgi:GT2 family glycosyltransferase
MMDKFSRDGPQESGSKVSVIVVNWNGERLLEECLTALFRQTYENREIIVVDNASSDQSVHFVREKFPDARLIVLAHNTGFTGGNRAGLEVAQGEFIALINNDTRAAESWLENPVRAMREFPEIGICASKLLLEGIGRINSTGGNMITGGVWFDRGFGEKPDCYGAQELVFGACGAAVLYRRKMLDEIGFLDKDFFLYGEDADLSFRAQLAGWKCMYVPDAIVYHKFHATSGTLSDVHVYYHLRNLEFVWLKNMPRALILKFGRDKWAQEREDFRNYCRRHGKWGVFFRAKRDALLMLPRMIRKRQEIRRKQTISDEAVASFLTPMFGEMMERHRRSAAAVLDAGK